MVEEVDLDGSGEIEIDEFLQMMEGCPDLPDTEFEEPEAPEPDVLEFLGNPVSSNALFICGPQNSFRKACQQLTCSSIFENFILFCILVSCVCLALDEPARHGDSSQDTTQAVLEVFE